MNMNSQYQDELDSICPIFIQQDKGIEQIGSGVVVDISGKVFILTAAHVMEWRSQGQLMVATSNGIEVILGVGSSVFVKAGFGRRRDVYDIAYIMLTDDFAEKVSAMFRPVARDEYWVTDNVMPDDAYSFSGYPLKKATQEEGVLSGEIFSYTGEAAIDKKYENLGYDQELNIVVNFRRKKSIDPIKGKQIPPHPRGISGGAVFRWPKAAENVGEKRFRYLAGIGHTFIEQHNCLVGTKLAFILRYIANQHPELFQEAREIGKDEIPMFLCFVGYLKDEWNLLMENFDDAANMQDSWLLWRDSLETGIEQMTKNGTFPVVMTVTDSEIMEYCRENGVRNVGKTRIAVANEKFVKMIREESL